MFLNFDLNFRFNFNVVGLRFVPIGKIFKLYSICEIRPKYYLGIVGCFQTFYLRNNRNTTMKNKM